ncbi:tyrosinase [Gigaspora margarita]|uniref:tyrosinase n=1 Tax=Gigaspora margarita TaxID=4874 RepID=A0A8H4EHU7_GIGMA|nr:tyrosinase [Gigaspora margarita]
MLFSANLYIKKKEVDSGFTFMDIDPTSYWAVASIHGLPYEPYDFLDNDQLGSDDWNPDDSKSGGYCHHGDILFPTWHRPYVLLLKQLIYDEAKNNIIPKYLDDRDKEGKLRADYLKALETLRFPYWDWSSSATLEKGLPSFFWKNTVLINAPKGAQHVPNPLRSSLLYFTTRPWNFKPCCNHGKYTDPNKKIQPLTENYGHYDSIKVIHDNVHGDVGGRGGHMSNPNVATFDPIFFLHHCTFTQQPDVALDENTPLTPFRQSETDFWTSAGVRDICKLGYTYPELKDKIRILLTATKVKN